ncbi:hypothetical protein DSO57_1021944 [Entomophthora muscae]|uniref:Uncharacterized protein n=1 Tax=Entomophthora muscae TaxID=34485 RepID=A0ACC2RHY6_9FUNG|nr:hypothetical protein DSO57_1021944 [Entomophthora muscae]
MIMQEANYTVHLGKSKVKNYHPQLRGAFSRGNDYVYDIVNYGQEKLAASSSTNQIKIFEKTNLTSSLTLEFHKDTITGLKAWNQASDQLLLSSSKDGYIALWDPRASNAPINTWHDPGSEIASFDFNCEGNILTAGTYLNESTREAKILFWDVRTKSLFRQFVDSHNDDITEIRFHPTISHQLLTGAMDGLICSFSLNEVEEDDALDKVINSGASISHANYFGSNSQFIYSMSHCETYSLWSAEGDPLFDFGSMKHASIHEFSMDYGICSKYDFLSNILYYIGGSFKGEIGIYKVNPTGRLELCEVLEGGHHDVVRSIHWDLPSGELISAGEDGNLASWGLRQACDSEANVTSRISKGPSKPRFSPY